MSINEINRNNSIKYKKFSTKFLTKNEYLLSIYILSLITMLLFDKLETQDQMKCILMYINKRANVLQNFKCCKYYFILTK